MHIDNGVTIILSRVGWVRNNVFMRIGRNGVFQSEEMLWFACGFYSPRSCHRYSRVDIV